MEITFGKYRGDEIDSLPDDYLKWVVDNVEDEKINEEAVRVLDERKDNFPSFSF